MDTMSTEMRRRADEMCDANGNTPFCKSANDVHGATMTNGMSRTANGHGVNGYLNGKGMYGVANDHHHLNGKVANGIHHDLNGKVHSAVNEEEENAAAGGARRRSYELPVSIKLLITAASGIVFGFAMEKGRVFEPHNIRHQMLFQNFVMLKMFLSAIVTSLLWFSLLSLLPVTTEKFHLARTNVGCRMASKGMKATAIGGAMLGIGMALSGACPGAALIEVGAGVHNAGMTFVGCLLGALFYGLTEASVIRALKPKTTSTIGKFDEWFRTPYYTLALPLALVLMLVLALIESLAPWRSELTSPNTGHAAGAAGVFLLRSWPPILAGALVGCLQLPIVLAVNEPIGGSRGYCTMVARLLPSSLLEKQSAYLLNSRTGLKNWWQVVYISSAIVGAAISSNLSGTWSSTSGVPPLHALMGGAIMVYGSRLAGGCTSGHGLSGIGVLSMLSFVAIPAMFVGGMATAATMSLIGIY